MVAAPADAAGGRQQLPALLLLLLLAAAPVAEGASEVAALMTIWESFTNSGSVLPDWNPQDSSPCQWKGVQCDSASGKVVELQLNELGLTGTLALNGWGDLSSLRTALLFRNSLTGNIPANWQLPGTLQELALDSNQLVGPIPKNLKLPASLRTLQLGYNTLTGPIGPWVLPPGLERLGIESNSLSGQISPDWALPDTLAILYAYNNSLSGTLSASWKLPKKLVSLDLGMNRLGGSIPSGWAIPGTTQEIYLDHNLLTGTVPADWSIPSLAVANLAYNNITGPLPSWKAPSTAQIQVMPQYGDGVCGEVPASTPFYTWQPTANSWVLLKTSDLATCPVKASAGSSWLFWRRSI